MELWGGNHFSRNPNTLGQYHFSRVNTRCCLRQEYEYNSLFTQESESKYPLGEMVTQLEVQWAYSAL